MTQIMVYQSSEMLITQSSLALCDPMDWTLKAPVHGILQARMLEWVVIPFSNHLVWSDFNFSHFSRCVEVAQ